MLKRTAMFGAALCSLALAGCMLTGCGSTNNTTGTNSTTEAAQTQTTTAGVETGTTGLANPVHTGTLEEAQQATGLALEAPEGATDVTYSYIDMGDGSAPMAQTQFTLDGKTFCYRAQSTGVTTLVEGADSTDAAEAALGLADAVENAQAFTGVYDTYAAAGTTLISERDAVFACNEGGTGFVQWLDAVPGVMYSLSMDAGATQDLLLQTAETCFVPTQGEA